LLGTLVTAAFFYPGYLDGDSNWQYAQGVSGKYNDMHPVVMSWLIGRLDQVVEGTGGYFLLLNAVFWVSLGAALRTFTSSLRRFVVAGLLIGTSVPVLSMLAQIQKDLGMVVGLFGAFVLLVESDRRKSLAPLLGTLPLLFYAVAVRHNGVTAALPFALWFAWLLVRDHLPAGLASRLASPWRRFAVGMLLLGTLFSLSVLATRAILGEKGERFYIEQVLMAYDMVGISVRSGDNVVSDLYYPGNPLTMHDLRRMYRSETAYYLLWGQPKSRKIPLTRAAMGLDRIQRTWLRAIGEHPGVYAKHRVVLFFASLGLGSHMTERHIGLPEGRSFDYRGPRVFAWPHARAMISWFDWAGPTPLFRAWPYLIIGAVAFAMAWRRPNRHRFEITLLAASVAVYIGPLLIVGVASEFRYMWWPVLVSMLQLFMALDGRIAQQKTEPG
jgi:hypothetical protein